MHTLKDLAIIESEKKALFKLSFSNEEIMFISK